MLHQNYYKYNGLALGHVAGTNAAPSSVKTALRHASSQHESIIYNTVHKVSESGTLEHLAADRPYADIAAI